MQVSNLQNEVASVEAARQEVDKTAANAQAELKRMAGAQKSGNGQGAPATNGGSQVEMMLRQQLQVGQDQFLEVKACGREACLQACNCLACLHVPCRCLPAGQLIFSSPDLKKRKQSMLNKGC